MEFQQIASELATGEGIVAGVLSGTSADGIDVGLARFPRASSRGEPPELLAFRTLPFPPEVGARLRGVLDGAPCDLRATALLHRDLGRAFGAATRDVARESGLEPCLVGSHGQTVWHHDGAEASGPATLQLGDADFIAETAGCAVVSDFRQRDVALGGEGAPLSALADDWIFAHVERPVAVLNLGGMANVTLLHEPQEVISFDTGPAGSLLDGVARRVLGQSFDDGGAVAASGSVQELRVARALEHPFFALPPPKSTGRDTFGQDFVDAFLETATGAAPTPADLLASAIAVVSSSIRDALTLHLPGPPPRVLVAGGGHLNRALMDALRRDLPSEVAPSSQVGVDPDAREALVFAVLAARAVLGIGVSAGATGARPGGLLGKFSPAPQSP